MSDLDGEDAFDRVLEKLMDANHSERLMREQLTQAHGQTRNVTDQATQLQRSVADLEAQFRDRAPALKELWASAANVRETVRGGHPHTTVGPASDCMKRLNAALEAANIACDGDDIPF